MISLQSGKVFDVKKIKAINNNEINILTAPKGELVQLLREAGITYAFENSIRVRPSKVSATPIR